MLLGIGYSNINSLSTDFLTTSDIIDFSDEEGYGKFLDLHEVYDMFINLKQMEVCRAKVVMHYSKTGLIMCIICFIESRLSNLCANI